MNKIAIDAVLGRIEESTGQDANPRISAIVYRMVRDLFYMIDDLDIQPEEFWAGLNYLAEAGRTGELGLIAPGLGFDHFLDLRMDDAEARAGVSGGTPRTIEGPLYVAGAPVAQGEARLDDGTDEGEVLVMEGRVLDGAGRPLPNATVEVWHANSMGNYSYFDTTQSAFNLRRSIVTDSEGRYRFRSIVPVGYSVPPGGATDRLLKQLDRHGTRPAHIHFFVSAPGHRKLTTQINIDGDPYLWDDFAFATREGLVPPVTRVEDAAAMKALGVDKPFSLIQFSFTLHADTANAPQAEVARQRALVTA
ncbi:Catechol 1,2-dioxygenase [Cupriavidus necator H850]|uniref:catechol 1,2-dioxygenase n=1 Tax=Cupriavidus necator TaxID=106590 RepID=UPI00129E9FCF|nr:catechol 1,2-dioxygenase [Cupriavidus necator]KAI3603376.1 Catechol 1,2-dioxygenase [Cupriavidus necator H850]